MRSPPMRTTQPWPSAKSVCRPSQRHLQNNAAIFFTMSTRLSCEQSCTSGLLEDFADTFARPGRTLEIVPSSNFLWNSHTLKEWLSYKAKITLEKWRTYLFSGHRSLVHPSQVFDYTRVTSKVLLACNENNGQISAEMHHLGYPLKKFNSVSIRVRISRQ